MVRQGTSGKNGSKPKGTPGRKPGRPPLKAVYRRRRLFVGLVLLLVASVALGGFAAVSGAMRSSEQASSTERNGSDASKPDAEPSASATPSTPATPTCDQGLVTVSASTDKAAYAADETPLLSLKVTNGGKVACEVNLGTSQMEYTVTSGSDRIFSSVDCQAESSDLVKTIAPGQSETANFPWQRNRSVPGCGAVSAKPGAGGAYYMFVARLGTKSSTKAVFQLL
ncbi:hypothetical protein [Arthrobacter sp. B10-11]|uniref:hypothetical protein n=1 Tax=Arthrobacter sp. B10-11 TaxID=3081160 RepID=UPI002954B9BC|nr:hypothetical protein [Arthrobacter sp. B10-11]MDV8147710.1 hypothetical protein [Arthrobacter sp. B10-11]